MRATAALVALVVVAVVAPSVRADSTLPSLPPSFSVLVQANTRASTLGPAAARLSSTTGSAWLTGAVPATQYVSLYVDAPNRRVALDWSTPFSSLTAATANGTKYELFQYPPANAGSGDDAVGSHWTNSLYPSGSVCTALPLNTTTDGDSLHDRMPYQREWARAAAAAGTPGAIEYMGSRDARGIPCDVFQTTVLVAPTSDTNNASASVVSANLTYWWVDPAHIQYVLPRSADAAASAAAARLPVRLEVTDPVTGALWQSFDFVSFVPGQPPAYNFALPPFGLCPAALGSGPKPFPHARSQDYVTELEINVAERHTTYLATNLYDTSRSRYRVEHRNYANATLQLTFFRSPADEPTPSRTYTVDYDLASRVAYRCVESSPPDPNTAVDLAVTPLPTSDLFLLTVPPYENYHYRGVASAARGVTCDVWHQLVQGTTVDRVFALEWYWAVDAWREVDANAANANTNAGGSDELATPVQLVVSAYDNVSLSVLRSYRQLAVPAPTLVHTFQFLGYRAATPRDTDFVIPYDLGALCPPGAPVAPAPAPDNSSGLSKGEVAGAVIGSLIGGLIIGYVIIRCVWQYSPPQGFVHLSTDPNPAAGKPVAGQVVAASPEPVPMTAVGPSPPVGTTDAV